MATVEELRPILDEATPLLEHGLRVARYAPDLDNDLQLRYSACGVGSAALKVYLSEHYDIETSQHITFPESAPRGLNWRRMSHVVLRHEDIIIDPTYSQFMLYVGLSAHGAMYDKPLKTEFPDEKIACFDINKSRAFANSFAKHAYDHAKAINDRPYIGRTPSPNEGILKDESLQKIQAVFRDIWSPAGYMPHTPSSEVAKYALIIAGAMQGQDLEELALLL